MVRGATLRSHAERRTLSGMMIGGADRAIRADRAARRYRLASWVLRMLAEESTEGPRTNR